MRVIKKEARKRKKVFRILTGLFFAAVSGVLIISNLYLGVSRYTVSSGKIPAAFDGFVIVQLSDWHNTSFGKENSQLLRLVEREEPDIVVLTGDMVSSSDTDFSVFLSACKKLAEKYPCYFIVGNHEQGLDKELMAGLLSGVEESGATVLDNGRVKLERDGAFVDLYGGYHEKYYYEYLRPMGPRGADMRLTADALERALGPCEKDAFSIMLQHNPLFFDAYAGWGADLTLCGHMHGGVIRLPFFGGVLSPERRLFPPYCGGAYFWGEKEMIVSRGIGISDGVYRFGSLPEIVAVRLRRG